MGRMPIPSYKEMVCLRLGSSGVVMLQLAERPRPSADKRRVVSHRMRPRFNPETTGRVEFASGAKKFTT
jgi:hypothetical protein